MSIQIMTRIFPSMYSPESLRDLIQPEDIGIPQKISMKSFADPRTNEIYYFETIAYKENKNASGDNIENMLIDKCQTFPGFFCLKKYDEKSASSSTSEYCVDPLASLYDNPYTLSLPLRISPTENTCFDSPFSNASIKPNKTLEPCASESIFSRPTLADKSQSQEKYLVDKYLNCHICGFQSFSVNSFKHHIDFHQSPPVAEKSNQERLQ